MPTVERSAPAPRPAFSFRRVRVHGTDREAEAAREAGEWGDEGSRRLFGGPPGIVQRKCGSGAPCSCPDCGEELAQRLSAQRFTLGPAGDEYEREADAVAARVVAADLTAVTATSSIRVSAVQSKADASGPAGSVRGNAAGGLVGRLVEGGGRPLDTASRAFFESRFGHDFGAVRVHDDDVAHEAAAAMGAQAFTMGAHVAFDRGRYAPHSREGRRLLAHELTHVVQQGASGAPMVQRAPARDLPTATAVNSLLRWPQEEPKKVTQSASLLRLRGTAVVTPGRPSVVAFLGPGATLRGLASSLVPIFSAAATSAPGVDELAKALAVFDEHIFLKPGTPLLREGQDVPLPIEVNPSDQGEWFVSLNLLNAWAATFPSASAPVLDQVPAKLTTPSPADLNKQVDDFLKDHPDDSQRCIALAVQLIANPFATAPFAMRLFERLGADASARMLLRLNEVLARSSFLAVASTRPGNQVLRAMARILSSPPSGLSADDEVRRRSALAVLPQEEPTAAVSPDFLIEGSVSDSASSPSVIFFRRGLALLDPVTEKAELDKLTKIVTDHPGDALTLNGSTSDDEDAGLALARTATVEAILKRGRPNVTDTEAAPQSKAGRPIGTGQGDYRRVRSVEIVLPGQTSQQPSCGGAIFEACTGAKYATREDNFKKADTRARQLLSDAVKSTGDASKKAQVQTLADRFFGAGADLKRLLEGIAAIEKQYPIEARNHACDNGCDNNCVLATAHNDGVGDKGKMVLCRRFDSTTDADFGAAVMIHETTHATAKLGVTGKEGAGDFAYSWERLFTELPTADPARTWRNADNWAWYIMGLRPGGSPDQPAPVTDDLALLSPTEQPQARLGLALAQKWVSWVDNWVSFAYQQVSERTPTKKDFGGTFAATVDALARNFGITSIKTAGKLNVPTLADQITIAGINQRVRDMWRDLAAPVKFGPGPLGSPGAWHQGSPSTLALGPTYFALTGDGLGEEVLRLVVASRPDIPAALRGVYVTFMIEIRDEFRKINP